MIRPTIKPAVNTSTKVAKNHDKANRYGIGMKQYVPYPIPIPVATPNSSPSSSPV